MFIAMSRFRIDRGFDVDFERLRREHQSGFAQVPGFVSSRLLKGLDDEETTRADYGARWVPKRSACC